MSQHDHLLKQLCGLRGETLDRARELLHIATVKTAPGSGFQLRDPLGRPAACALIASEQLKNTVVDPTSAQGNSCLNPAAFKRCLAEVRAALAHDASNQPTSPSKRRQTRSESISRVSYDSLVSKYALSQTYGDRFGGWCQRAEFAFFDLGKGNNISRDSPKIKHGIFFWVCAILEPDRLDLASFVEDSGAHSDNTRSIYKIMEVHGVNIRAVIREESKRPKDTVTTRSATRSSPGKRLLREAPSKDSPKKRKLSPEEDAEGSTTQSQSNTAKVGPFKGLFPPSASPRKSPSKSILREIPTKDSNKKARPTVVVQENSDVEMSPPETPSKTRVRAPSKDKTLSISPSRPRFVRNSDRPNSATASPSKGIIDIEAIYIDNYPDDVDRSTSVRRRFRPVFLDRKQWSSQHPLPAKVQKRIEKITLV